MKQGILILSLVAITGCSDGLTFSGYQARPISLLTASECAVLGPASDSKHMRSSSFQDTAIETASARNRAAAMGGNAVVFSTASSITASKVPATSFQLDTYRCPSTFLGQ